MKDLVYYILYYVLVFPLYIQQYMHYIARSKGSFPLYMLIFSFVVSSFIFIKRKTFIDMYYIGSNIYLVIYVVYSNIYKTSVTEILLLIFSISMCCYYNVYEKTKNKTILLIFLSVTATLITVVSYLRFLYDYGNNQVILASFFALQINTVVYNCINVSKKPARKPKK